MITNLEHRIDGAISKITGKPAAEISNSMTLGELGLTNPIAETQLLLEIQSRTTREIDFLKSGDTVGQLKALIEHELNVEVLIGE